MSVATIDYTTEETATVVHDADVVDVTSWTGPSANLRRSFTGVYVPRHRADGPAR